MATKPGGGGKAEGWCCCYPGCWSYIDYWNDPITLLCRTKLGPHWRDVSPNLEPTSWNIFTLLEGGCVLVEDGNPGAFLLCQDAVPIGPDTEENYGGSYSPNMFAAAQVLSTASAGDKYFLRLCYTEGTAGISYLEYEWTWTGTLIEQRLYKVTNGTREELASLAGLCAYDAPDPPSNILLTACYNEGAFRGGGGSIPQPDAVEPWGGEIRAFVGYPEQGGALPGWRAGFGHEASHYVIFGPWMITQLHPDDHSCPDCGECYCYRDPAGSEEPEGPVVPAIRTIELTATFTSSCPGLDGKTVTLKSKKCAVEAGSGSGHTGVARGWGFWEPHVDEFGVLRAYIVATGCQDHGGGPGPEMSGPWSLGLNNAGSGLMVWDSELFGEPPPGAVEGQAIYGIGCACIQGTGPIPTPLTLLWDEEESSCDPLILVFPSTGYHLEAPLDPPTAVPNDCWPCDPDYPDGIEEYGPGDSCPWLLPGEEVDISYIVTVTE
jgi:hypothetical protein